MARHQQQQKKLAKISLGLKQKFWSGNCSVKTEEAFQNFQQNISSIVSFFIILGSQLRR